jgi:hypothetical protein
MAGVKPRDSCKNIFKRLEMLTLPCEYILSLMIFMVKNQEMFPTNSTIHTVNTRNKNDVIILLFDMSNCNFSAVMDEKRNSVGKVFFCHEY